MPDKNRTLAAAEREINLGRDRATLEAIGAIYCKGHHGGAAHGDGGSLCAECAEVVAYAMARTEKCPNHHEGNCKDCTIHCYAGEMRDRVKAMMAYSAPRMLLRHPVMTVRHLRKKMKGRKLR